MERTSELEPKEIDTPESAILADLLKQRRSCRAFRPEAVSEAIIGRVLELAQFSASWCNAQPWQLIITKGKATEDLRKALLADIQDNPQAQSDLVFPERYSGVFLERKRTVGWQLYNQLGVERGDREGSRRAAMENFHLFGAPHVAILTTERELGIYGAVDCGFYAAHFQIAAQSLGVATIAQAALAQRAPLLRRHFDIPVERQILLAISFGYANDAHPANQFGSTRADLPEVVKWVSGNQG